MNPKPITPYRRLLDEFREVWNKVQFAHRVKMWTYPKAKLGELWKLADLAERVQAGQQLGYECVIEHTDAGLEVFYRKKAPQRPYVL